MGLLDEKVISIRLKIFSEVYHNSSQTEKIFFGKLTKLPRFWKDPWGCVVVQGNGEGRYTSVLI